MINVGTCPKCEKMVSSVNVEHVNIQEAFKPKWHGASLLCPFCNTILGVAVDPIAMKSDLLDEIAHMFKLKR